MLASRLLLFGLGRVSTSVSFSVRLKSSLSEGVASPPCSPQVESAHRSAQLIWEASLPDWHGLLYRHDLPKCSRPSNVRGHRYFDPLFWEKSKKVRKCHNFWVLWILNLLLFYVSKLGTIDLSSTSAEKCFLETLQCENRIFHFIFT